MTSWEIESAAAAAHSKTWRIFGPRNQRASVLEWGGAFDAPVDFEFVRFRERLSMHRVRTLTTSAFQLPCFRLTSCHDVEGTDDDNGQTSQGGRTRPGQTDHGGK